MEFVSVKRKITEVEEEEVTEVEQEEERVLVEEIPVLEEEVPVVVEEVPVETKAMDDMSSNELSPKERHVQRQHAEQMSLAKMLRDQRKILEQQYGIEKEVPIVVEQEPVEANYRQQYVEQTSIAKMLADRRKILEEKFKSTLQREEMEINAIPMETVNKSTLGKRSFHQSFDILPMSSPENVLDLSSKAKSASTENVRRTGFNIRIGQRRYVSDVLPLPSSFKGRGSLEHLPTNSQPIRMVVVRPPMDVIRPGHIPVMSQPVGVLRPRIMSQPMRWIRPVRIPEISESMGVMRTRIPIRRELLRVLRPQYPVMSESMGVMRTRIPIRSELLRVLRPQYAVRSESVRVLRPQPILRPTFPPRPTVPVVIESAEVGKYHCTRCEKNFASNFTLQRHSSGCVGKKVTEYHTCSVCGKQLANAKQLAEHRCKGAKEERFQCSKCPAEFTLKHNMVTHERKCQGNVPNIGDVVPSPEVDNTDLGPTSPWPIDTEREIAEDVDDIATRLEESDLEGAVGTSKGRPPWTERESIVLSEAYNKCKEMEPNESGRFWDAVHAECSRQPGFNRTQNACAKRAAILGISKRPDRSVRAETIETKFPLPMFDDERRIRSIIENSATLDNDYAAEMENFNFILCKTTDELKRPPVGFEKYEHGMTASSSVDYDDEHDQCEFIDEVDEEQMSKAIHRLLVIPLLDEDGNRVESSLLGFTKKHNNGDYVENGLRQTLCGEGCASWYTAVVKKKLVFDVENIKTVCVCKDEYTARQAKFICVNESDTDFLENYRRTYPAQLDDPDGMLLTNLADLIHNWKPRKK